MAELYRYAAFISYSSKDAAFAKRLHRALETYTIPKSLGLFDIVNGGKENRIFPVFRDREELAAGHLGDVIEANLRASAALIVVCSLNAAASPWVQKEIEYFVRLGRQDRVFTIIPDSAPLRAADGADATPACFPAAFRDGSIEPLAADARKGKDGFRNAWLKVVAGLIGVNAGALADRDAQRRRVQRLQMSLVGVLLAFGLAAAACVVASVQLQNRSNTLAEAAHAATDSGDYTRGARFARAALTGWNWPFVQFDGAAAEAELRRAVTDSPLERVFAQEADVSAMDLSSDGSLLASGGADGVARVWNFASGQQVAVLRGDASVSPASPSARITGTLPPLRKMEQRGFGILPARVRLRR